MRLALLLVLALISSTGLAGAQAASDADLINRLQALRAHPPVGRCPELASTLNPPYWEAQRLIAKGQASEKLKALTVWLKSFRQDKGCLLPCPNGAGPGCDRPPTCKDLWGDYQEVRLRLLTCRGDASKQHRSRPSAGCSRYPPVDAQSAGVTLYERHLETDGLRAKQGPTACAEVHDLESAFETLFVEVVRECPRDDEEVSAALQDILMIPDPNRVTQRLVELLRRGQVGDDRALALLKELLDSAGSRLFVDVLRELTATLKQMQGKPNVTEEAVIEVVAAVNGLLVGQLSQPSLHKTSRLLKGLSKQGQVQRSLQLLDLANDLNTPAKQRALQDAVDLLLKHRPDLEKRLPPDPHRSLEGVIGTLVGIMNDVDLAELSRYRQAAASWHLLDVQLRREGLLTVPLLLPCEGAGGTGASCQLARELRNEFVRAVYGQSPQGTTLASVPGASAQAILSLSQEFASATATPADECRKKYGDLCTPQPYAGVVVLEIRDMPAGAGIEATAAWRVHGTNEDIRTCAVAGSGDPCPKRIATATNAAHEGFELGKDAMKQSGVAQIGRPPPFVAPNPVDVEPDTEPLAPLDAGWRAAVFSGLPWFTDRQPSNNWAGWAATGLEVAAVAGGVTLLAMGISERGDVQGRSQTERMQAVDRAQRKATLGANLLLLGVPIVRLGSWGAYELTYEVNW